MATSNWTAGVSGDWNTGTLWTPGTVPNDAAADVTIDATPPVGGSYTVTIAAGESETIQSLTMNSTDANRVLANTDPYSAGELELDGTLIFSAGSTGLIDGSLQTFIHTQGSATAAKIVNAGTINGFIQVEGNLQLTGTNGVYVTNAMQALAGTIVIDTTSIAEMTGQTLFDGIFEAKGGGSIINLGGALGGLIVNIATIEGPPLVLGGWTELTYNDITAQLNEWNGTAYVGIETTLTDIKGAGTVDVLAGRNFDMGSHTLTIEAGVGAIASGMLNLHAGTFKTGGITIAGGIVQGAGTIVGGVVNNGTLVAEGGTLSLTDGLTGTGQVNFDLDQQAGTVVAAGATLIVGAVSAGQTITMNGRDTLQLAAPSSFAGKINAKLGDRIVLAGSTITSATFNNGTLTVLNGAQTVASLALSGDYTGEQFTASGSTITVAPGGTMAAQQLPPPVNGLSTADISSADLSAALAQTGTLAFISGTQAVKLVDGTLSVGANTNQATLQRLYMGLLGRSGDTAGLSSLDAQLTAGASKATVAAEFLASPEYVTAHAGQTSAQFLTSLYQGFLGRAPDVGGLASWTNTLAAGASRGEVAAAFADSTEAKDHLAAATARVWVPDAAGTLVHELYQTGLGREVELAALPYYQAVYATQTPSAFAAQLAAQIVASPEFMADHVGQNNAAYVTSLYQNGLGRAPDAAGLAAWTSALNNGSVGRSEMLLTFATSQEAAARLTHNLTT